MGSVAILGLTSTVISNGLWLQRLGGGVITILMGLVFMGVIPALQREARLAPKSLSTLGGCTAAWGCLRARLDSLFGSDAYGRHSSGLCHRGGANCISWRFCL